MKQQPIRLRPARVRQMGLRRAPLRKPAVPPRNDHIYLFSTENNARRIREALQQFEEGRGVLMTEEEFVARYGLGEDRHPAHPSARRPQAPPDLPFGSVCRRTRVLDH